MLVLWDVDGTLLRAGEAGRLAFADAFADVFGTPVDHGRLPRMSGKTDPQIALELLTGLGVPSPESHLPVLQEALVRGLTGRIDQIRAEGVVLPGVRELIDSLAGIGAVQTLVTGNVAANARIKLAAVGLLGEAPGPLRLDVGAYGSDDADRDSLVPIAMRRCRAAGLDVDEERTWVIGDTPRDLACARAAGVRCLLVATGTYPLEALTAAGFVSKDSEPTETDRVRALLTA